MLVAGATGGVGQLVTAKLLEVSRQLKVSIRRERFFFFFLFFFLLNPCCQLLPIKTCSEATASAP